MNRKRYTATVIIIAALTGLGVGTAINTDTFNEAFSQQHVHEHALFFIQVNGSQLDLTAERFQLESSKVHLENNKSHIVHKHAEGVTWGQFLDTIETNINRTGNQSCINMPENRYCGNMTVLLNGEKFRSKKEIQQGDNLAIVIGNNSRETAEALMEFDLPDPYRKIKPGTKV